MLQPKRVKYRKMQKGCAKGVEQRATDLVFGSIGLKSLSTSWIKSSQIEAARRTILRHLKGKGKTWIRIFPDKPVTFKGDEVGMGGGKGSVSHYVYSIRPGRIIFEIDGVSKDTAKAALREAGGKLPIKTKIIED